MLVEEYLCLCVLTAIVLSIRIIYEIVVLSFKKFARMLLIFDYVTCIKCSYFNNMCSVYCGVAM